MGLKPTCREVHQLVSKSMDLPLTVIERLRVQVHLVVCDACTRFDGQMLLLRQAMRRLSDRPDPLPPADESVQS